MCRNVNTWSHLYEIHCLLSFLAMKASWKCNKHCWDDRLHCHILLRSLLCCQSVGGSTVVMGIKNTQYGELGKPPILATVLTVEHKPEDLLEQKRVKSLANSWQSWPPSYMYGLPVPLQLRHLHSGINILPGKRTGNWLHALIASVRFSAGHTCLIRVYLCSVLLGKSIRKFINTHR